MKKKTYNTRVLSLVHRGKFMITIGRLFVTMLVSTPYFVVVLLITFHYFRTILERFLTAFPG